MAEPEEPRLSPEELRAAMLSGSPTGSGLRDDLGRFQPGSVPGWAYSWWVWSEGLDARAMTPDARLAAVVRYWHAVADGWQPPVPREQWVGPHDPFHSNT